MNLLDNGNAHCEERVQVLHAWIRRLCDPDVNFCESLMPDFETTCQSVVERNFEGGGGKYTDLATRKLGGKLLTCITETAQESELQDGPINITKEDGSRIEGSFKKGVPHGYFRYLDSTGDLEFFGCFVRGIGHGLCWKGLAGGGFLVSPSWDFSTNNTIYLYPDCRTVLVGNFYKGQMVQARLAQVVGSSGFCSYFCGSLQPELSEPKGQIYSYDPSTSTRLSSQCLLPDPYEQEFVCVRRSHIPRAGEGLFAKCDIEMGTVLCFYNGIRLEAGSEDDTGHGLDEYRIVLDATTDLSIPAGMTSLKEYAGSLGHKVCHSFTPNTEFDTFYHPRFGNVRCLASIRNISKGEEITVNYRYSLPVSPNWYKVAWAKHQKLVRGLPDWKLAVNFGLNRRSRTSLSSSTSDKSESSEDGFNF